MLKTTMFLHRLRNYPRNHYSGIQFIMPSTNAGLTSILQRKKPNVNIFFCSFWGSPHQIIFLQLPFSQASSSITSTFCMSSFTTSINPPHSTSFVQSAHYPSSANHLRLASQANLHMLFWRLLYDDIDLRLSDIWQQM